MLEEIEFKTSHKIKGQRSGAYLDTFYLAVVDHFGGICTNVQSQVYLEVREVSSLDYSSTATSSRDIKCQNGIFNISEVKAVAEPGTSIKLVVRAKEAFD